MSSGRTAIDRPLPSPSPVGGDTTLPRTRRASSHAGRMDVRDVLRRGARRHAPLVVAHVVQRGDDAPTRWAVVASRRVGGAVRRNRAKRVLRAAAASLPRTGLDVVLVARAATPAASANAVGRWIEHMFDAVRSDSHPPGSTRNARR